MSWRNLNAKSKSMWLVSQAAVPQILEKTDDEFFSKIINILRQAVEVLYETVAAIPCLTCPVKPEGSMAVMVRTQNPRLTMLFMPRFYTHRKVFHHSGQVKPTTT